MYRPVLLQLAPARAGLFAHGLRPPAAPCAHRAAFQRSKISATILVKNSAILIDPVLKALRWCDEVVVFDTGSTDDTLKLAEKYANVSVHRLDGPFPGFGRARRRAVDLARNDWIFSVDSDEVVTPELADEIAGLRLDPETVYSMPFENYFNGRLITSCGWAPDRHGRLFNRAFTNFCDSRVHERVKTEGLRVRRLRHHVEHYSYKSVDEFLAKMRSYGRLFAAQNSGRKSSSPAKAVSRALWAFFKTYLLQRGFLQGYEGLLISAYNSQTVFWKYLLLHEANRGRS